MTVDTPNPTALLSSAVRSMREGLTLANEQVGRLGTLLSQVRAYLTTVLATGGTGGSIDPGELQAILDEISQAEEDLRQMAADAATAVQANQLPGMSPPVPPTPGTPKA